MTDRTNPDLDLTETPCAECDEVSTENEEMICCDGCQQWFHSRCVGVTADANKEAKWYCAGEVCQKKKKKNSRTKKSGDDSSVKSDRSTSLANKANRRNKNGWNRS